MKQRHGRRRLAGFVARALLALYPPSFRRELGEALFEDVRQRDTDLSRVGGTGRRLAWLVRLTASLVINAPGAWAEALIPNGRGAQRRRARWARLAGRLPSVAQLGGARAPAFSWLDLKLGVRMLLKYPGLTLAGGLGIAVAIGASAGFFAFAYAFFYPVIPLDEGHRLVGLENWDLERNNEERRSLHDYHVWRDEMRSVEDMSAFRTEARNLGTGDGPVELVRFAEMTPVGFELARVPPFMGRTLVPADAEPGAPDVMVIGYDVWRTRFAADPDIVGREVRLGRAVHTIVGVMPEGFAFPMNHDYWVPFRHRPADYAMGEGPSIFISGRLAPGYTMEDARAELTLIGERMAAAYPDTHRRFRAQLMPYVYPLVDVNQAAGEDILPQFLAVNGFISLLLVLVGLNIAVLVYARTATRRGEIAVRTALGAARGRIVGQLFAEALMLSLVGAALGLLLAKVGLGLGDRIMAGEVAETPFWLELGIPGPAVIYTLGLTILTAVITGVLPGLQATSRRVHENIRRYHSGTGLRLGRTWTALIVLQISVTVAGLPLAVASGWGEVSDASTLPAYPTEEFLVAFLIPDQGGLTDEEWNTSEQELTAHLTDTRAEVMRRVGSRPGVAAQSHLVDLPLGRRARVLVEGTGSVPESGDSHDVRTTRAHSDFFETFEVGVRTGRPIVAADLEEGAGDVVVVDQTFVERVLAGRDALGHRIAFVRPGAAAPEGEERWFEIVGVAENLHRNRVDPNLVAPHVYQPLRDPLPAGFAVRVEGGEPTTLTEPIRAAVAELDPTLRVTTMTVDRLYEQERFALLLVALILGLVAASVLLLSAAGIYALMSFTVSQRTREIGIRTALGAQPGRLLGGILKKALAQLAVGLALGTATVLVIDWRAGGEALQGYGVFLVSAMVVVMTAVGLLAALGPARRGLGVAPAEVLQSE